MSHTVISVENLGKEYVIGSRENARETFREMLVSAAAAPFRRLRRLSGKAAPEKRIWALKDVSFAVKEGEVVGIIGRNGAGKSTLLKILSRITAPSEGRVTIRGRVSSLLEVGTGFHPELTGRENIYLNGAILGMSRIEIDRKFDDIVDFSGIEKFLDTPMKRYSSGMQVRLAFAVAAHLEPEILVVDEVLAVGDAEFQKKCLGKMKDVAGLGRTVLFVSHNMGAIQNLCSRCIGFRQGQVFLDSEPAKVIDAYLQEAYHKANGVLPSFIDRGGDGKTRFTEVILLNEDNQVVTNAACGKTLKINLVTTGLVSDRTCRVAVAFSTLQGNSLFVCSSELIPEVSFTANTKEIVCEVPRLPLGAGSYLLSLFLEQDGCVSDWISDGLELVVEDRDFFGSGRNTPQGWEGKTVLVEHSWYGIPRTKTVRRCSNGILPFRDSEATGD